MEDLKKANTKDVVNFVPVENFPEGEEAGSTFLGVIVPAEQLPADQQKEGFTAIAWWKPSRPMTEEEWQDLSVQLLDDDVQHTVVMLMRDPGNNVLQIKPLFRKEGETVTLSIDRSENGAVASMVKYH